MTQGSESARFGEHATDTNATTMRRAVTSAGRIRSSPAQAAGVFGGYPQCASDRITSPVRASASAAGAPLTSVDS
ncbi:hypothetical protein [Streptomyces subrutilus]|uniref:Uncharacterized protein n=1 Tax=Streptomyces subrutilus TaxID=36818 RepID=A0A1E5PZ81_9ACTN|nr:hypothetical protein [Streptomyces subrutilus]OEJ34875.1 hypothetical protein BGK67_29225 [Streptomyces subrutilus]